MNKRFLIPVSIIATALLLSACNSATPTTTTTTKTETPTTITNTEAKTVYATISNFAFDPSVININVGDTVVWTNKDTTPHIVKAKDNSFTSSSIPTDGTYSFEFTKGGIFNYYCGIHPTMEGTVVVK